MHRLRVGLAARAALAFLLALGLALAPAATATAARQETATARPLDPAAGWHGRAVQQLHDHAAVRVAARPVPPGWSAGPVSLGAGYDRAGGSRRVREVQRRLRRLGYAVGPVDGRLGPRTRAALAWFQRKHGLPSDGRAVLATVRHLRARTGAAATPAPPARDPAPAPAAEAAPPRAADPARTAPAASAGDRPAPSLWTPAAAAIGALGLVLLAAGWTLARRERRPTPARPPAPPPLPAPRRPARPHAIGYVRLARGASSASFHAQAAAIEVGCLARGLTLVSLVSDVEPDRGATGRPPALAFALGWLEEGDVDRLVVSRADHVSRSPAEAEELLQAVAASRAGLVVLDRDLDTSALPVPEALEALGRQAPAAPRRPRELDDPRPIDAHIASMLEEGLDPGAIAAALNAEPVPPPRGGRWGSSGVEEAARRRRGTTRTERFDG